MTNNSVCVYEPLYDSDKFFDEVFSIFNQCLSDGSQVLRHPIDGGDRNIATGTFKPRMDLHEDADKNLVTATFELPGLRKEDVNIELQSNSLIISGESTLLRLRQERLRTLLEALWQIC